MRRIKRWLRTVIINILREGSRPTEIEDLLQIKARQDSADFVYTNLRHATLHRSREDLWTRCITYSNMLERPKCVILEFGVHRGDSINWFASRVPQSRVFGFDTFTGLPEAWTGEADMGMGTFSLAGEPPPVQDNVTLIKGLFQETLPSFLRDSGIDRVDLLHLDADLYSSTKFVLTELKPLIGAGTIICFDDFLMTTSWREHEFRAWTEFLAEHPLDYRYIGFAGSQAAVQVL